VLDSINPYMPMMLDVLVELAEMADKGLLVFQIYSPFAILNRKLVVLSLLRRYS
jgi:hypothetical protein